MRKSKYLLCVWMSEKNRHIWPRMKHQILTIELFTYLMPWMSCCTAFNRCVIAQRRTMHGTTLYNLLTTDSASGATFARGRMPYVMESWLPGMARFIIGISFNRSGISVIHDFRWSTVTAIASITESLTETRSRISYYKISNIWCNWIYQKLRKKE